MSVLQIDRQDPVVVLTLNRPEKLNALDQAVLHELLRGLEELERADAVRVAVLTGAGGKAFAAGADIAAMLEMSPEEAKQFAALGHRAADAIERARFPVIAAVNGFALGGGCEIAMACDFLYASEGAKLGQPEVGLGIMPGFGGTQRLTRRVGASRARELCMTGRTVGADEALRMGWVDAVLPSDVLLPKVLELASLIASKAPLAVAAIKRAILRGQDVPLPVANEIEAAWFASLFGTDDQREGMRAFVDKRRPSFQGR
ncbi:MAG TPA: enoyl-CoA hydratase-related protein [Polyangiaceae bacterium]|nr:enoyl-CoA hydratase-related protein [Polyangiaceae bacterium]